MNEDLQKVDAGPPPVEPAKTPAPVKPPAGPPLGAKAPAPRPVGIVALVLDKHYVTGDIIEIAVRWPEPVTARGVPRLALKIGTNDREAVYVAGSGTNTLLFHYTVTSFDVAAAGHFSLAGTVFPHMGTIKHILEGVLHEHEMPNALLSFTTPPGTTENVTVN
jgi:hypothetical protein